MMKFIYDFYLLDINRNDKNFEVKNLQIDNTTILTNNFFATAKEKKLKKAKLVAKNRKNLILHTPIKLNRGYIKLGDDNRLFFK